MSGSRWRRFVGQLATAYGCSLEVTRGGHLAIRHPAGWTVYTSSTPSDSRAMRNVESEVARAARAAPRSIPARP